MSKCALCSVLTRHGWRAHSFTYSLTSHSRTQSGGHIHSLTHSFTHLQISHTEWNANSTHTLASYSHKQSRGHTHSLTNLAFSHTEERSHSFQFAFTQRLEGTLTHSLPLIHSLSHSLTHSPTHLLSTLNSRKKYLTDSLSLSHTLSQIRFAFTLYILSLSLSLSLLRTNTQ